MAAVLQVVLVMMVASGGDDGGDDPYADCLGNAAWIADGYGMDLTTMPMWFDGGIAVLVIVVVL